MNKTQIERIREKTMTAENKVYNAKVYQYWINGNGQLARAKKQDLNTIECEIEILD